MKEDQVRALLTEIARGKPQVTYGEWVMVSCPFAPYDKQHKSSLDHNVSFGVHVADDRESKFNCFTCHRRGSVARLARDLSEFMGIDLSHWADANETDKLNADILPWVDALDKNITKERSKVDSLPYVMYESFKSAANHPYVIGRGINRKAVRKLDMRVDPDDRGVERILFPLLDVEGKLYGILGRATDDSVQPKVREYSGFPKSRFLLGMQLITDSDPYVIVVEGPFDLARLVGEGYQAIAILGSAITDEQLLLLKDMNKQTYLMLDDDKAGMAGCTRIVKGMGSLAEQLMRVRYPVSAKAAGRKDPGSLHLSEIVRMFKSAVPVQLGRY